MLSVASAMDLMHIYVCVCVGWGVQGGWQIEAIFHWGTSWISLKPSAIPVPAMCISLSTTTKPKQAADLVLVQRCYPAMIVGQNSLQHHSDSLKFSSHCWIDHQLQLYTCNPSVGAHKQRFLVLNLRKKMQGHFHRN